MNEPQLPALKATPAPQPEPQPWPAAGRWAEYGDRALTLVALGAVLALIVLTLPGM